jgi:hypothetical protein
LSLFPVGLSEAKQAQAKKDYKDLKKQPMRRIKWLTGLSAALAAENKTTEAQEKENYIRREEHRKVARQIKRVNGKLRAGSVTSVIAPSPQHPNLRLEMTSKADMEEACLAENKRRFNQAADTPCMQSPLYDLLGPLGITEAADRILDGTFETPPGVDKHTAGILRRMNIPDIERQFPPLRLDITTPEHVEAWRKSRERTASGPTGVHCGHLPGGIYDPVIADFEATMDKLPLGYFTRRSRKGTNCMLEKNKNVTDFETLRTILSYDASFNLGNKTFGRRMMFRAEAMDAAAPDQHVIAPEQFGSRRRNRANTHCINKRLFFDHMRQL